LDHKRLYEKHFNIPWGFVMPSMCKGGNLQNAKVFEMLTMEVIAHAWGGTLI
jgi:hypothetical protein